IGFKMTPPIVCFVGHSNSGKTTLIEKLIPELTQEGYRIATIKHAGHGFDLDTEGKDSWRHKRAGASQVVVLSKGSLAMFTDVPEELPVEEVRDRFVNDGIDLIIAEGWKSDGFPKVVVVREELQEVNVSLEGLLAVASIKPIDTDAPWFDRDDVQGLAKIIISRFPRQVDS
ncbi:MAG: molybdopterin-guanine dinucleotide biosynthesis protein B, partial [Nitrospirota bacterium]|nr:molybdopterin-guanine dinucleotide biosynthesis protein B [Nitrospirota bacterium]